jgi:signal transduction histidine kinase
LTTEERADGPVSRFWTKINLMAEIAAVFRKAPAERATYQKALETIQRVVSFSGATLYLISQNRGRVTEVAAYGSRFDPRPYDRWESFTEWIRRQRQAVLLSATERYGGAEQLHHESVLLVPLLVDNNLIGAVVYVADGSGAFEEKDIKLLTVVGDQIALSIERLIYQRELERKNDALRYAQEKLKKAHEQLIVDEKLTAVKQLAVSVNHEINNPLSVITGNVEYLLYMNTDLDDRVVDRLKIIETEALRIAEINRKLLDIQSLVSESYIRDDDDVHMLNLDKSSSGGTK